MRNQKENSNLTFPNPENKFFQQNTHLSDSEKIISLREFTCSETGQIQILSFIDNLRQQVGDQKGWHQTCQNAQNEISNHSINSSTVQKLFKISDLYISQMSPGHDRGHFYRDALTAILLYSQCKNQFNSQAEAQAALLGGIFHDIGTAIIPRHADKEFGAGHAESGAYLFWQLSENILGTNLRKLICYNIAAHTNYQDEIVAKTPKNYIKKPYWDQVNIINSPSSNTQKFESFAPIFTRVIDRADIYSPNQVTRSLLAQLYSNAVNQNGDYESGGKWISMSPETAFNLCLPLITSHINNEPTAIEHSLAFARNFKNATYHNKYDHIIPQISELLKKRSQQTIELGEITAQTTLDISTNKKTINLNKIKSIFQKTSLSKPQKFDIFWQEFTNIWQKLIPDHQQSWQLIFEYIDDIRKSDLALAQKNIATIDPNFQNLYQQLITKLS